MVGLCHLIKVSLIIVFSSEPAVASQQLPLKAEPLPVTNLNFKVSK